MRIIGGKYQRRQIVAPAKLPVRPTTDMAKEALFSIINNHFDFESIRVLDLFAGTGNISYEFASRGALEVIAVDINNYCTQFIKKTAETLQMENLRAVRAEVFHFLGFAKAGFDIVFCDPPYDFEGIPEIPSRVFSAGVVLPGGWLVIEHSEKHYFTDHPLFSEKRKYGKVHFSFFKVPEQN
jgi:16S rRNA (guanine(966)-N(2))-methyltransferase RsmD